jgi:ribosomal protein S18 acetylase RimI-like enzyme
MPPHMVRLATTKDAPLIAAIHIDSWKHAFPGVMRADWLAQQTPDAVAGEWRTTLGQAPGSVHVAEDSSARIVGFICSGCTPPPGVAGYDGEIFSIHIRSDAKRLGHGRRLMSAAFQRLGSLHCRNVMLWTLEHNHVAGDFYQDLGGRVVARSRKDFAGRLQPVVAYGWDSLSLGRTQFPCP